MASSHSEDEDVKVAIALSLMPERSSTPTASCQQSGILGLDRKAMEAERLARHASKRSRSISPPAPSRSSKKSRRLEETIVDMPSGARLKMFTLRPDQEQEKRKSETANAAAQHTRSKPPQVDIKSEPRDNTPRLLAPDALKYPTGVVKKTWAYGHERTGGEVKLEEVLEAATLTTAVLSAYQWDVDWVLSKLRIPPSGGKTKCIFVMQGKTREDQAQCRKDAAYMSKYLRLCFPPMNGLVWCMHSKLMLLFHPPKLRIAIPTANLLDFDWGETGQMENSVFMIDLPRLHHKQTVNDLTFFGKELMFFIEAQGFDEDVRNGVLNFDFSATANIAFVHTVGGIHHKDDAARTGLLGLSRTIRHLNLTSNADSTQLDFAASSIGQLNDKFLRDLATSACGVDLFAQRAKINSNFFGPGTAKQPSTPNINNNLRIYFPTKETVQASTAKAAGTICLQRRYFGGKTFPRDRFRDYKSTRRGLLSHNKILCARGRDVAWVYVGSSNMSKSAWGEVPADRSGRERKISCRNWECGVVLPVSLVKKEGKVDMRKRVDFLAPVGEDAKPNSRAGDSAGGKKRAPVGEDAETASEDAETANEDAETESEDGSPAYRQRHAPPVGEDAEIDSENEVEVSSASEDAETASEEDTARDEVVGMEVFKSVLDLPFEYPGDAYNGREPWYFQEKH